MRAIVLATAVMMLAARPSEACVQLGEANTLLGWSEDGKHALHARIRGGKLEHAEILPTRYEGWKYVIYPEGGRIYVRKIAVTSCAVFEEDASEVVESVHGTFTEDALRRLTTVAALKIVDPPADDGGASKLTASFTPRKRYAEHQLVVTGDRKSAVATLAIPVWCFGSCLRDEDWKKWGATITKQAKVGDRVLYVVRMARVCNGGNDKDMWIERVVAVPGTEKKPKSRCRGSG